MHAGRSEMGKCVFGKCILQIAVRKDGIKANQPPFDNLPI